MQTVRSSAAPARDATRDSSIRGAAGASWALLCLLSAGQKSVRRGVIGDRSAGAAVIL